MIEPGIETKELYKALGYQPHADQWLVHNSKARFKIPTCGRRWGKSVVAAREMLPGLFVPDAWQWIVGPTYPLGEKEFRVLYYDIMQRLGLAKYVKSSYNVEQGNMRIQMPWDAVLEVKSAQKADSLRGEGLYKVCMSEAAFQPKDVFDMYIRPALADFRGGGIFPSTPNGHNWYEGLWMLGQSEDSPDYESWRFPSWENPYVYPEGEFDSEMNAIRDSTPEVIFQQEYGAEFTAFEGKIYSELKPEVHIKPTPYNPFWQNFLAIDWGFTDPTVVLDIMVDPDQRMYIWREYRATKKTSQENALAIAGRDNPPHYHRDHIFADPRNPDAILTASRILGPISANPIPWDDGVTALKTQMLTRNDGTTGFIIDPTCTNTIRSLTNLRTKSEKEGQNTKEGQHDYDDHEADATRYFASEYYFLGYGGNLADIYSQRTEAHTYFKYHSNIKNDTRFR